MNDAAKKSTKPKKSRRMTVPLPDDIRVEIEKVGADLESPSLVKAAVERFVVAKIHGAGVQAIVSEYLSAKLGKAQPKE